MLLAYTRVSTAEQAADGTTSLEEQSRVIYGYAMAKGFNKFDVNIYEDAGVSGSLPLRLRPAGADLLEAVKPGDTVIAAKLDRLFRNSLDALKVYTDFKERGIHLVLFDLGTTPITDDSGISKLIFSILSAFSDHERGVIRERILGGKAAKKAKGGHTGGEAPYGFRIVGEKRESRLEPAEEEQRVIKRVCELDKWRPHMIARQLADEQIFTRTGRPFAPIQIKRILVREGRAIQ